MADGFSFDLAAADWRRGLTDEKAYVKALAVRLQQALPDKTQVEYDRHWFSKDEEVSSIEVTFDHTRFILQFDKRHGLTAERAKVVRGICLKRDTIPFAEWLSGLSEELEAYATEHESARAALEQFLFS